MKIKKINLNIETEDGEITVIPISIPVVVPTPVPTPLPTTKYVMLNAINWNQAGLNILPIKDTTEVTYFVLPVSALGVLEGGSPTLETKFVNDVHVQGKKATFSIAGGAQNVANITSAVTTYRTALINNIASRIIQYGYDGVTVDIENTALNPQIIVDFINALRVKIGVNKIIGMYVQPYQLTSVMSKLELCASSLNWLSPMIYDYTYTMDKLKSDTKAWLTKVPKEKLLCGVAVNYPTGLNTAQYAEVLDWVKAEGLKGVGVWQNNLFTEPWLVAQRSKINVQ